MPELLAEILLTSSNQYGPYILMGSYERQVDVFELFKWIWDAAQIL